MWCSKYALGAWKLCFAQICISACNILSTATYMQDTKDMTDIQALIEHFNSLPAGSSLHMEQQSLAMVSKPLSSDNAGFLLGNPAIVPVAQAVTKANVETGLFQLQDGVPESNICHISGSNKTLSDLTMEMMSGDELQCLVLERCNGVSLCDTIFKGASENLQTVT